MNQAGSPTGPAVTTAGRLSISQLDTIRVVAMLAVFFHHLWKTVIITPEGTGQKILDPIFAAASDGVILFNILSGFLLALPHLGPEKRPFEGYRQFLLKRLSRVIPPYYLALLIFTAANIVWFSYPLLSAAAMLVQHLLFVNSLDYTNMFSNFSHFWYLGQLAQFYLLFPLVLLVFRTAGPTTATLAITSISWASWVFMNWYLPSGAADFPNLADKLMHFNLPGRLPEFAFGMWLSSLWKPEPGGARQAVLTRPFAPFAAAMALYMVMGGPFIDKMPLALLHIWHVALSLIIFLCLFTWSVSEKTGASAAFRHMGAHSYSIYIVHVPVFSYLGVMPSNVTHSIGNFILLTAGLLPICYAAAVALDTMAGWVIRRLPTDRKRSGR